MYPFDAGEHSQHKRRTVSIKGRRDKPKWTHNRKNAERILKKVR